jgi:hypothetical protein
MRHFCKYIFMAMCAVALLACSDKYVIKGASSQRMFDGKVAYIKHANNGRYELIDSCKVVHGKFVMEGLVDSVMCVSLFMGEHNCIPFVLEYGDINISFANSTIKIEGTPLNDKLYSFLSSRDSLMLQLAELPTVRNMMILEGRDLMEVHRELAAYEHEIVREIKSLEKGFVEENFDNVLGLSWFMQMCDDATMRHGYPTTTPLIEEILVSAPEDFKCHPVVSGFMKRVDDAMYGNMPGGSAAPPKMPKVRQTPPNVHNARY